ncbi:helix-turn-helix domain-containing protein [Candidatus Riflebacteria bacterium]
MWERQLKLRIGKVIQQARRQQGISQEALAEKCKIRRESLSAIETGKRHITLRYLNRIANALDVPLSEFIEKAEKVVL